MIERTVAAYRVNSSAIAVALLVITNLIPLVGVLWLGWDLMLILALYWAENGVVGVINILKILTAEGDELQSLDHALVGERPPGRAHSVASARPGSSPSTTACSGSCTACSCSRSSRP